MEKGKLIVMEGLDGCGKTTQIHRLANYIRRNIGPVWTTRECTDGPVGQLILKYLQKELVGDERIINMLYAPDRLDHIVKPGGILDHLHAGEYVITDRYYHSSMAYWTYPYVDDSRAFSEKLREIISWNSYAMDLATPDLVIYLDVPIETIMQRIRKGRENPSVFEQESKLIGIEKAYRKSLRWCRDTNHEEVITVDGTGDEEEVAQRIWSLLQAWKNYWDEHPIEEEEP